MAVSNLSPYQLAIQSVVGKARGAVATPQQLAQIADQTFGPAPVPPGSRIISQDATTVRWIDPEGYEHVATRSLDGRDPNAGRWNLTQTNRPNVLPNRQQEGVTQALGAQVQQNLTSPLAFAQLDPQTLAQLKAISDAEQAANAQINEDQRGQLVAQLYGNRVNQSSIANQAAANFAQRYGLVQQQQQSDAAARLLQLQQFLTNLGSDRNNQLASLYAALSGQGTQRAIAEGGLNLDYAKLNEGARQASQGFELEQQKADMALAEQRSALNKILKASQIASNIAGVVSGVGTGLSAFNALSSGRNAIPAPTGVGAQNPPYTPVWPGLNPRRVPGF
jgi:hypothetical protein